jgi:arginyl-tRNA synthetase
MFPVEVGVFNRYNGVGMIRDEIKKDLTQAVRNATGVEIEDVHLEHPANPEHGDHATNVALTQISNLKSQIHNSKLKTKNPREIAELIASKFPKTDYLEKIEVAPPGFINFFLKKEWLQEQVGRILEERGEYGISSKFKVQNSKFKIQVEFISANPTGPLHIGNARGGFCGDVLANVLEKVGFKVQREYYINDKGGQIDKLAKSVEARCSTLQIPEGGYSGDYVREIAENAAAKNLKSFEDLKTFAISEILKNIKKTIVRMGIKFDNFFSEASLYGSSQAQRAINFLQEKNLTYEKEGAVWFRSSKFGDEKDRVLIKSDGEMTYLVSDIAYHLNKFEKRKFDQVILFWGADHHGYVPRFMAMVEAIGHKGQARVALIQLLKLARGGKEVRMSKRAGEYVTVDDVLDEIGRDAARFHFLATPLNTPMTLDLEKAREQSQKNPVYYVQYAHARMHSILAKCQNSKLKSQNLSQTSKLNHPTELSLIRKLIQLPEVVVDISRNHEVHRLPQYATEIADAFHRFYENCQVLSDDAELMAARLGLVKATQIILAEVLSLMGISAPEHM